MNDKIQNYEDNQSRGSLDFFMETRILWKFEYFLTNMNLGVSYNFERDGFLDNKAKMIKLWNARVVNF